MAGLGHRLPPPSGRLRATVVVPARDEEDLIAACVRALGVQEGIAEDEWELLLVLDGCRDRTGERALAAAGTLSLRILELEGAGAGAARAAGMDAACERFELLGRPTGLIATTDADTRVAPDWLVGQLDAIASGSEAIGGRIELEPDETQRLSARTVAARRRDLAARRRALGAGGRVDHPHFGGASIGITARAYRAAGGMRPLTALEDEGLARSLTAAGIRIDRLDQVRVSTSARTGGRAPRGLAGDLRLAEWMNDHCWQGSSFDAEELAERRQRSVSVILPAREVARTIAPIVGAILPLRESGLIDELIVVDAASEDGTAELAARAGADVRQESELLSQFGPCRGKGDAMWRAASAAGGELLLFVDADTVDFDPAFVIGMLGPILTEPGLKLVKGAFERPFRANGSEVAGEGGRVTELVARPFLNMHFPELAGFRQPLAGEVAIDRELFRSLPVPAGYGVEIGMLIDAACRAGLGALGQVELGSRQNRHQSLRDLSRMAYEVMYAAHARVPDLPPPPDPGALAVPAADGTVQRLRPVCEERPPLRTLAVPGGAELGAASA